MIAANSSGPGQPSLGLKRKLKLLVLGNGLRPDPPDRSLDVLITEMAAETSLEVRSEIGQPRLVQPRPACCNPTPRTATPDRHPGIRAKASVRLIVT